MTVRGPASNKRTPRTLSLIWLCAFVVLVSLTAIWPRAGKVDALLVSIASLPLMAGAGIAVWRHHFHVAVLHHRCEDARLPRSRSATTMLIVAVVMAGALVIGVLVGLIAMLVRAVGHPPLGDVRIVVVILLGGPGLTAALVGSFLLALRSRRMTALFVKLSRPAPWSSTTDLADESAS